MTKNGQAVIAEIRARYPNPVKCSKEAEKQGCYCVGGALCLSVWGSGVMRNNFPLSPYIVEALERLNPRLIRDRSVAYNFALSIVNYNEDNQFEKAWHVAETALNWRV